jgi:hypothetical protein
MGQYYQYGICLFFLGGGRKGAQQPNSGLGSLTVEVPGSHTTSWTPLKE